MLFSMQNVLVILAYTYDVFKSKENAFKKEKNVVKLLKSIVDRHIMGDQIDIKDDDKLILK